MSHRGDWVCGTCAFWYIGEGCTLGECRLYPPLASCDGIACYPMIRKDDWCGQWLSEEEYQER